MALLLPLIPYIIAITVNLYFNVYLPMYYYMKIMVVTAADMDTDYLYTAGGCLYIFFVSTRCVFLIFHIFFRTVYYTSTITVIHLFRVRVIAVCSFYNFFSFFWRTAI